MAMVMAQSHAEVVPVTIMDDVNISAWAKEKDFTVRMILAMAKACQEEPSLNAWFDGTQMGRRLLSDIHIGIAMDTPDGLFVPVIKDVKTKSAAELREEIKSLKKEVHDRVIAPEKLKGATIILSNFGNFAGRYANPIVVPPMVAILGAGVVRQEMVVRDSKAEIGEVLPLSLSFDHRAVTGGEATRFLAAIMRHLEQG
jgi:pyruvate dehydrogenase E2 component (dihydrolipoamide acetyltransferase)